MSEYVRPTHEELEAKFQACLHDNLLVPCKLFSNPERRAAGHYIAFRCPDCCFGFVGTITFPRTYNEKTQGTFERDIRDLPENLRPKK